MVEGSLGSTPFFVIFMQIGAILGNSNGYICLDIIPQQEGRLPIYLNGDEHLYSFSDIYPFIHCMCRYSTCSKYDKCKPLLKSSMRAKRAEKNI